MRSALYVGKQIVRVEPSTRQPIIFWLRPSERSGNTIRPSPHYLTQLGPFSMARSIVYGVHASPQSTETPCSQVLRVSKKGCKLFIQAAGRTNTPGAAGVGGKGVAVKGQREDTAGDLASIFYTTLFSLPCQSAVFVASTMAERTDDCHFGCPRRGRQVLVLVGVFRIDAI
jgi:hypothetical protein